MHNRSNLIIISFAISGNDTLLTPPASRSPPPSTGAGRRRQKVRKVYGDPVKTSFSSNGFESWEYEFIRMQSRPTNFIPYVNLVHSGADGEKKSLVIFFDKRKVVQDYTMSASKVEVSRGLITR